MKQIQQWMRISVLGIIVIFMVLFGSVQPSGILLFMYLLIGAIALVIVIVVLNRKLEHLFRERVIKVALTETFDDFVYEPNHGFDETFIFDTSLFPRGNRFKSTDRVLVRFGDKSIEFADVEIENVRHTQESRHVVTYFKGKWMVIQAQKPIESKLYIIDRDNHASRPKGWFSGRDLEKVAMESIRFNDIYRVFATEPHDAFYALTPQKLEQMCNLDHHDLSIYQDKGLIHLAINSAKPMVEIPLFRHLDERVEINRIKDQLGMLLDLDRFFGVEGKEV